MARMNIHERNRAIGMLQAGQSLRRERHSISNMEPIGLSQSEIEELKDAFSLFDKNDDNSISLSELKPILQVLGQNPTDAFIQEVMTKADKDGNASLDQNEFTELLKGFLKPRDVVEVELREAFRVFDKDKNNTLDIQEMRRALCYLGEPLTVEDCKELFSDMGVETGKEVDVEAFVKHMCKRY